jgi:hypothetical protein
MPIFDLVLLGEWCRFVVADVSKEFNRDFRISIADFRFGACRESGVDALSLMSRRNSTGIFEFRLPIFDLVRSRRVVSILCR